MNIDDAKVSICMMWIENAKTLVLLTQPWDEDLPSSVARWLNRADGGAYRSCDTWAKVVLKRREDFAFEQLINWREVISFLEDST